MIVIITYGIQPTGAVTMAMEVLHNSCNMCSSDCPICMPSGLGYTYQIYPSFPYYNYRCLGKIHSWKYLKKIHGTKFSS